MAKESKIKKSDVIKVGAGFGAGAAAALIADKCIVPKIKTKIAAKKAAKADKTVDVNLNNRPANENGD